MLGLIILLFYGFQQTIYEMRNSTVDLDALVKWFPDMSKYVWSGIFTMTNEQDEIVFCGEFETELYQFRLQDRYTFFISI